jgi:hypothetical protein
MRDLLLFALCCGLAASFWLSSERRSQERAAALQQRLYQLGAPQSMTDSPERSLLLGDFAQGLRADPSPETYQKLAPLFLVSHGLKDGNVETSAFTSDLMGRVVGKQMEFFDAQGRSLLPRLWTLTDQVTTLDKPLFEADASPTLAADGPWLLYGDKVRTAAFRQFDEDLRGYVSGGKITIDGDVLLIDGEKSWTWVQGQLEAVPKG